MKRIKYVISCVCIIVLIGCTQNNKTVKINETVIAQAELIYENKFEGNLDDWKVEQMPGGKVEIKDGKLETTDVKGCTTWLKRVF